MPSTPDALVAALGTAIGQGWLWALAIIAVLFLFVLGMSALKGGIVTVLRHVRAAFHL